jgi:hypothetical protein
MHKRILQDLRDSHLTGVIAQGRARAVPRGIFTDVMDRLAPASDDWESVRNNFTRLRCRVRARYSGSNESPDTPLLMLEVDPLQELPTTKPPDSATPWHISVAFYNPQRKQSFKAIERRYTQWREYTLIGWIQGASFYLDPQRCPVGSDPDLQALIRSDPWYGHKPIHISL